MLKILHDHVPYAWAMKMLQCTKVMQDFSHQLYIGTCRDVQVCKGTCHRYAQGAQSIVLLGMLRKRIQV